MPDCTGGCNFALFNFALAFPRRGAVGGDDGFAALEGFGDDKTEVLGEGRENKDVAPGPDFLELVTKGATDNAKVYWTLIIICGIRWLARRIARWMGGAGISGGGGGRGF